MLHLMKSKNQRTAEILVFIKSETLSLSCTSRHSAITLLLRSIVSEQAQPKGIYKYDPDLPHSENETRPDAPGKLPKIHDDRTWPLIISDQIARFYPPGESLRTREVGYMHNAAS
jgi:hypothetical protein